MEISSAWTDAERLATIGRLAQQAMVSTVHRPNLRRAADAIECISMVAQASAAFLEGNRTKIDHAVAGELDPPPPTATRR
jgi:hypothetical protein